MNQQSVSAISASEKYLEFEVGDKLYAYHIRKVAEIMEYPEVEPLPLAPDFVLGAINLRGSVIPIVDLATCLDRPTKAVTPKSCVIISDVEYQGVIYQVGVKVDLVTRVIDISSDQIEEAPDMAGQLEHRVLIGVAKLDNRLLTILNVDTLLTHAQIGWLKKSQLSEAAMSDELQE